MTTRRDKVTDPWAQAAGGSQGPVERLGRWAREHHRVAGDSLIYISHRFGTSALVWLLIGIALALPGGLYLLQTNLAAMSATWEGRPGITVYMKVEVDAAAARTLRDELAAEPGVVRVTLITADAALAEFEKFSGVSDALAHLDRNPLPASLRLLLKDDTPAEQFDAFASGLRSRTGVEEVSIEKTWLQRVQAMTTVIRRLSAVLALMFSVGAILVTATSVRLAIESKLEELRVMKLVGATNAYLRRPFLYFGLFYGLGGGIAGAMLISAVLGVLEAPLATLLGSYGQSLEPAGLNVAFFSVLIGCGGILGVIGALLAARQRLVSLQIV